LTFFLRYVATLKATPAIKEAADFMLPLV